MPTKKPMRPVRRAVADSVKCVKEIFQTESSKGSKTGRPLRYESLEERRVLSATGLGGAADSGFVASDDGGSDFGFTQDEAISYLKVAVNGDVRELTTQQNRLDLVAGDVVEVLEIGVHTDAQEGVFAAEGYFNKLSDLSNASLVDYNDGRFSGRERDFTATGEDGTIGGLANSWTVEMGWDRLTVNLMHYTDDATEVAGRFFATVQVGQPDFAFDTDHLDTVLEQEITEGDEVSIPARWYNNLEGLFHNYAELDIYNAAEPDKIVWAGAAVGNAGAGNSIEGEFVNTRSDDPFSARWTPDVAGEYILKYTVDPEAVNQESNEGNNTYELRVTVAEKETIIAVDDYLGAGESLDVMKNDVPANAAETIYEEDFEGESIAWTVNHSGTDNATTGAWVAAQPTPTSWNGVQLQLEAASGQRALVTGAYDDGSVGYDDVDDGVTSALSDLIAVPENTNVELSFQYNFAHLDNATTADYFRVSLVSDGEVELILDEAAGAFDRAGKWEEFKFSLANYAGQEVQILVEAGDHGEGSLVEAAIDKVIVEVPASEMWVHEFTQASNGTVTLNDDGTFSYTANPGFIGQDSFTYALTDGDNVSNVATVTVNVESQFLVEPQAAGDEDSEIGLNVQTSYEAVIITGVPEAAFLNRGEQIGTGEYKVAQADLDGLTITPAENSDVDFTLTLTPIDNDVRLENMSQQIAVTVEAVIDGGQVTFEDFGILTGSKGDVPVSSFFGDLDGSESHQVRITGLPDFVKLSGGERDGDGWLVDADDLDRLRIAANKVSDTDDWEDYQGRYVFKKFSVTAVLESFEANGSGSLISESDFELVVWQKTK